MNKQDEIAILREAVLKMGSQSYCGPWLEEQIPFIESDIRSDLPPVASWTASKKLAEERIHSSMFEASQIVLKARQQSEKVRDDSDESCRRAIEACNRAIWEISKR